MKHLVEHIAAQPGFEETAFRTAALRSRLTCSRPCSPSCALQDCRRVTCRSPCSARWLPTPTSQCRRTPTCSPPSPTPWTSLVLPAWPAPQGHCADDQSGCRHLTCRWIGHYLVRICHYREYHARVACRALHCGQRQHLNDDLQIVTLSPALISAPPIDLWPRIVRRRAVPPDTEELLAELENDETLRDKNNAEDLMGRKERGTCSKLQLQR
jgi:hypothetical protein